MPRFTIPQRNGKSAMRIIQKKSLLAFFDFVDNENGLEYKDWKLMKGQHGNFVGSPSAQSYVDKNGKTIWPDYVKAAYDPNTKSKRNALGDQFFADLLAVAEGEYDRLSGGEEPTPRRKAGGAGPMAKKSAAAPVPDFPDMEDDGDDSLPF